MEKTRMQQTAETGMTDVWNDSCSLSELEYAIANGAVGATTNPVIVLNVLKKEMNLWEERICQMVEEMQEATEDDIAWKLIEEMGLRGAEKLMLVFEREKGMKGRLSMQTNAKYYRSCDSIVRQAVHFAGLAPNIQVKIPVTKAGIQAIEEATYRGVNINATVSFTVPQAIAVAEAVERGLRRRETEGMDTKQMTPVCTIMVGRTDDWIKEAGKEAGFLIDPECYEWAGVAVAKKAYRLYRERKYRTRLLFGALRNHYHWSELTGGDVVLTIPHGWQVRINESDIEVKERMEDPVNERYIKTLLEKIPDFGKAYDEDGMGIDEFDGYGATKKTLRSFLEGYAELVSVIRGFMIKK
ncbi:transaldolase family protein [Dorea sp. D27]|uniref:transaldolase family protein n=1 Tax=Dorea sp. D27 TaxID=658665 RepID=UPI0006732AF0|nr:transaldolase family protein [Dorea sp. D27]KMZ53693.1 transaldolase [Dorea sp. D27]